MGSKWVRLAALAAVTALGCAPHVVPTRLPATSAASLRASEARPADVTVATRSHPPLPGEDAEGWRLGQTAPGGHAHHHHGAAPPDAGDGGHAH